jgi:hypothetical protein
MQNLMTIKLAGNAGINYDLPACDLEPDYFTAGSNYVLRNGKIQTFCGSTSMNGGPGAANQLAQIMFVQSGSANYFVCLGQKVIKCFDGATWSEIGSGGYSLMGPNDYLQWNFCKLGSIPIINNVQGYPQYWSPQTPSSHVTDLPFSITETWTQKGYRTKVIRAHKNFLFALGMFEGANDYPNNYRWSTAADNNGIPYTWDPLDLSGIAGTASILGNNGPIVDGMSMRDAFVIYTTDGITVLEPSGDLYIWRARSLSDTVGLMSQNCIANINGNHIFLSRSDIMINDGNSIRSITDKKIKTKLKGLISSVSFDTSFCIVDERTREVWFCVPDANSTYPNLAIIYNWAFDQISVKYLDHPYTAMCYGPATFLTTSSSWDLATENWNTKQGIWSSDSASLFSFEIIGIEPAGSALYNQGQNDGTSGLLTNLERTSVVFGDQRNVTTIIRVYPHMHGSSPIAMQFGSQDYVDGPTRWEPIVNFTPANDRKIDLRTTGKLHCWRITATDSIGFTYNGMDIEYVQNGVR